MQTCFHRDRTTLARAVRAAVAAHRPDILHALLARVGSARFAQGVAGLGARIREDALSMLSLEAPAAVAGHRAARLNTVARWRTVFASLRIH
jgi:hypothetical protein